MNTLLLCGASDMNATLKHVDNGKFAPNFWMFNSAGVCLNRTQQSITIAVMSCSTVVFNESLLIEKSNPWFTQPVEVLEFFV